MKLFRKINGYVLRYCPDHPRAFTSGSKNKNGHKGYVYEHILVAEREIGRPLTEHEEVHHLDFNRSNNRPRNLLVLLATQHSKLHVYLKSIGFDEPAISHKEQKYSKIPRCKICRYPLSTKMKHTCSLECWTAYKSKKQKCIDANRPDKAELLKLMQKYSWVEIGKRIGLSDNGARKYAKRLGVY